MGALTRPLAAAKEEVQRLEHELSQLKEREAQLTEDKDGLRAQRTQAKGKLARKHAELTLLLSAAVQRELDRMGNPTDGMNALASLSGMTPQSIWDLLSNQAAPDAETWHRIYRLLAVCQSRLTPQSVTSARRISDEMVLLHNEADRLSQEIASISQEWSQIHRQAERVQVELERVYRRIDAMTSMEAAKAGEARIDDLPAPPYAPPGLPDLEGNEYQPDPLQATTPAEFVAAMRAYRQWAGNPSLREMERRCGNRISYSTFRNMLIRDTVPAKLYSVHTFVQVLGGTPEDLQRWATAWRRFTMRQHSSTSREASGNVLRMTGT